MSTHMDYSRKPGFTETRLRPLARRRDRTFWPPWVFMRVRKPCFFDRLRRLGWNVRLGMEKYLLLIAATVLRQMVSINERWKKRQAGGVERFVTVRKRFAFRIRDREGK